MKRRKPNANTRALRDVIHDAMATTKPGETVTFPIPGVLRAAFVRRVENLDAQQAEARIRAQPANDERADEARAVLAARKTSLKKAGYLPLGQRHTLKDAAGHLAEVFGLEHAKAYAWLRKKRSEGKL